MSHFDGYYGTTAGRCQFRSLALAILSIGLTTAAAQADDVKLNGACEVGNCVTPGSISFGQSIPTTPFSFAYTAPSTDPYNISGTYAAKYDANGTSFTVYLSADYTGVGPSIGTDTFTVDVLQDFFDSSPGTWDGLYAEYISFTIGAGVGSSSSVSAQFLWDGQGVGLAGPYSGSGTYNSYMTKNLTGLTGDTLTGDFQANFSFDPGTQPSSSIGITSPIPEPVEVLPIAASLVCLAWIRMRRRKFGSSANDKSTC